MSASRNFHLCHLFYQTKMTKSLGKSVLGRLNRFPTLALPSSGSKGCPPRRQRRAKDSQLSAPLRRITSVVKVYPRLSVATRTGQPPTMTLLVIPLCGMRYYQAWQQPICIGCDIALISQPARGELSATSSLLAGTLAAMEDVLTCFVLSSPPSANADF